MNDAAQVAAPEAQPLDPVSMEHTMAMFAKSAARAAAAYSAKAVTLAMKCLDDDESKAMLYLESAKYALGVAHEADALGDRHMARG